MNRLLDYCVEEQLADPCPLDLASRKHRFGERDIVHIQRMAYAIEKNRTDIPAPWGMNNSASQPVIVEADGWFIATVPDMPGVITQAKNMEELRINLLEAQIGWMSARLDEWLKDWQK